MSVYMYQLSVYIHLSISISRYRTSGAKECPTSVPTVVEFQSTKTSYMDQRAARTLKVLTVCCV